MSTERHNPFAGLKLNPGDSSRHSGRSWRDSIRPSVSQALEDILQAERPDGKYLVNHDADSFLLWFEVDQDRSRRESTEGDSVLEYLADEIVESHNCTAIRVSASFSGSTRLKCLLKERPAFFPAKDALKAANWKINNRFQITGNFPEATLSLFDSPRIIELLLMLKTSITVSLAGQNFLITSDDVPAGIKRGNLALRLLELASELTSQLRTITLPR